MEAVQTSRAALACSRKWWEHSSRRGLNRKPKVQTAEEVRPDLVMTEPGPSTKTIEQRRNMDWSPRAPKKIDLSREFGRRTKNLSGQEKSLVVESSSG
jgi:hypothetical protein